MTADGLNRQTGTLDALRHRTAAIDDGVVDTRTCVDALGRELQLVKELANLRMRIEDAVGAALVEHALRPFRADHTACTPGRVDDLDAETPRTKDESCSEAGDSRPDHHDIGVNLHSAGLQVRLPTS